MKTPQTILTALLIAATAAVWAQGPSTGTPREQRPPTGPAMSQRGGPQGDPIGEFFFPPELVMQNQQALGLTEEQKATIKEAIQKSMMQFTDLQWQQSAETEILNSMFREDRPDEAKTLAQFDKLLKIESEIKRLHMGAMIRIKNTLTVEQQAKLRELRRTMPAPGGNPQGAGRGMPQAPGGVMTPLERSPEGPRNPSPER